VLFQHCNTEIHHPHYSIPCCPFLAVIVFQSYTRHYLATAKVELLRHTRKMCAATLIQSLWRGVYGNKWFVKTRSSAIRIQSHVRKFIAMERFYQSKSAVTKIVTFWKRHYCQRMYTRIVRGAWEQVWVSLVTTKSYPYLTACVSFLPRCDCVSVGREALCCNKKISAASAPASCCISNTNPSKVASICIHEEFGCVKDCIPMEKIPLRDDLHANSER
jgi:hypothetical protein